MEINGFRYDPIKRKYFPENAVERVKRKRDEKQTERLEIVPEKSQNLATTIQDLQLNASTRKLNYGGLDLMVSRLVPSSLALDHDLGNIVDFRMYGSQGFFACNNSMLANVILNEKRIHTIDLIFDWSEVRWLQSIEKFSQILIGSRFI